MKAIFSSKTSVPTKAISRYTLEAGILRSHRRGNLKSYITRSYSENMKMLHDVSVLATVPMLHLSIADIELRATHVYGQGHSGF
jgi:hypothetical protein